VSSCTRGGRKGAWDCATAKVHAPHCHRLLAPCADPMSVLTDTGCQATTGAPATMPVCPRGPWTTRRRMATGWSRLTTVGQSKQVGQRVWVSCCARVAWTMAAFKLLARWGREMDAENLGRLSIAEFSL
jgi:hypothetical protein